MRGQAGASWARRRRQGLCLLSQGSFCACLVRVHPPVTDFCSLATPALYLFMQHPAMKPDPAHGEPTTTSSSFSASSSGRELAVLGSSPPELCAMATETVVLKVTMSCEGCSGAVRRVLSKMQGVESFDIDMKQQKVTVKGNVKPEDVFQTVFKTGKKTAFWEGEAAAPAAPVPATEAAPTAAAAEAAPSAAAEAPAAAATEPEITPAKADA